MKSIIELEYEMKDLLPEKRYRHTLGVAYTAACLAMRYGCEPDRAMTAGLLHDCAKYLPDEEQLLECGRRHIPVSDTERQAPYLLHGKLGACYAKERYQIEDEEILSAIRVHTTGKPKMTCLEQILFVADYMEPGRKLIPGLPEIRKTVFLDLDLATALILENTLKYLQETSAVIDPRTEETLQFYQKRK